MFRCAVCRYFRNGVDFINYRGSLPVPKDVRFQFAAVPEFFLEAIMDFVLFCCR